MFVDLSDYPKYKAASKLTSADCQLPGVSAGCQATAPDQKIVDIRLGF